MLFKALLLQQWHGLSDPELEDALKDRLSFRRFLGVSLSEQLPITVRYGVSANNWPKAVWPIGHLQS